MLGLIIALITLKISELQSSFRQEISYRVRVDISTQRSNYPTYRSRVLDYLIADPRKRQAFCLEAHRDVGPLKVLVLHHHLEGGPKDAPLELVDEVAYGVVELGLLRNVGCVDAQLSLADQDVAVPEVDQQIAVVGLEAVFDPDDLEAFPALCLRGAFQPPQKGDYLFGCVALDLAPQQVVDVEGELLPPGPVLQVVFGQLDQQTQAVNDQLVCSRLDRALEEEVVDDGCPCSDELHEGLRVFEVGTLLEQVFGPLHEDPPNSAGVEGRLALAGDLPDLRTGERVVAQQVLHVSVEALLFFDGSFEQEADVLVDGLIVHVGGVGEAFRREVLKQVDSGRCGGDVGEVNLVGNCCLGIPFFQSFEQIKESIVRRLSK